MILEPLFQPCDFGPLKLQSHFVMSSMQDRRPDDLLPSADLAKYYRDRIKGGIGLINTQGTTMDHPTSESPFARLFPPAYEGWQRCAETVREHGGHIAMQLWHEGASRDGGCGPSGLSFSGQMRGRALTRSEIDEIVEIYAFSAFMVKKLGFSAVELHGGHGYLIGLFLAGEANKRTDDYGGATFEERMRFGLDVTRAVRQAVGPDFPIMIRLSQLPREKGPQLYKTPDELAMWVRALQDEGVDMFDTNSPRYWQQEYPGVDMNIAGWIKQFTGAPVISNGCFGLSNDMSSMIAGEPAEDTSSQGFDDLMRRYNRGDFDCVALGRTILLDPDYLKKLRDGRLDDIKKKYVYADVSSARHAGAKTNYNPQATLS